MTKTVFVDANILIAAAGSRTGASRSILNLAEMGLIQLVVSRQVLDESERNLRDKLPRGLPILAEWLTLIIDLQIVPDPKLEAYTRWLALIEEKDAPILEAAVGAKVDYFLTLNTKDFTPEVAAASGLTILMPGVFIQNVRTILNRNL